jgi:hypothetical protein
MRCRESGDGGTATLEGMPQESGFRVLYRAAMKRAAKERPA